MILLNFLFIFCTIFKSSYAGWAFDINFDKELQNFLDMKRPIDGARNDCPVAPNDCPREVTYWFYSRNNLDGVQLNTDDLENAGFLADKQYKILIHGYQNDHNSLMITSLKNAYLEYGEYNVIAVDWGHYAKPGCYPEARSSINPVAGCVTTFLTRVVGAGNFNRIHLLGHSLGAHISARVSSHFDNPKISRLTRFDPALPLFLAGNTDEGKAEFRDCYHSNSEVLGQKSPQGDVDIYFNNDSFQPGCECDLACSHMRSVLYFAESINRRDGMKGFKCGFWEKFLNGECPQPTHETLVDVGDRADTRLKGSFKVFGRPNSPFLYSENDYLNKDTFEGFKRLGGECTQAVIDNMGNKIEEYLSDNQVSRVLKRIM